MDDIADISPDDDTPLESMLRRMPPAPEPIVAFWQEDELHPYTDYEREQDRVKYIRLWYRDHLAPPV